MRKLKLVLESDFIPISLARKLPKKFCNSWYWYAECQFIWNKSDPIFVSKEKFYDISKARWGSWISNNYIFIELPTKTELFFMKLFLIVFFIEKIS